MAQTLHLECSPPFPSCARHSPDTTQLHPASFHQGNALISRTVIRWASSRKFLLSPQAIRGPFPKALSQDTVGSPRTLVAQGGPEDNTWARPGFCFPPCTQHGRTKKRCSTKKKLSLSSSRSEMGRIFGERHREAQRGNGRTQDRLRSVQPARTPSCRGRAPCLSSEHAAQI